MCSIVVSHWASPDPERRCDKPDKMGLSGRWATGLVLVAVLWESVIQCSCYDCPVHPGCFAVSTISQIKLSQETLTQNQTAGSKTAVSLTVSALCGCILTHAYWLSNTIESQQTPTSPQLLSQEMRNKRCRCLGFFIICQFVCLWFFLFSWLIFDHLE